MTLTAHRSAPSAGLSGRARSSALRHRLLLHLASRRRRSGGPLSAGFTLVELMIVIVIVGVLSAVAIPNFLAQTEKAKSTEAKSSIAATIKQAQAQYLEDGLAPRTAIADMNTFYKTPLDGTTKFNYTAAWAAGTAPNGVYTVTATGNATDSSITGKTIIGCVQMGTGVVKFKSNFADAAPVCPT